MTYYYPAKYQRTEKSLNLGGKLVPFFNPREQKWEEHFQLNGSVICPLTAEGRVTVKIFRLNDEDRQTERQRMIEAGLFRISHLHSLSGLIAVGGDAVRETEELYNA